MFCTNCGSSLDDNVKFCRMCGTPVQRAAGQIDENVTPVGAQPVDFQTNAQPADYQTEQGWDARAEEYLAQTSVEWNKTEQNQKKPRKWKKWVIIGGSAAAVCIAVGVTFLVAGARIRNFFNSMKSPEDYYRIVESDYIDSRGKLMLNAYNLGAKTVHADSSRELNVRFKMNPMLQTMLNSFANNSITGNSGIDFSKFSDIEFHSRIGAKDMSELAAIGDITINGERLIDYKTYSNLSTGESFISFPMLSAAFLKIDGKNAFSDMGSFETARQLVQAIPDDDTLERIVERYRDIALSGINNVTKSSGSLTVGSVSQDCTILEATLTGNDLNNIIKNCLTAMRSDEELRVIFDRLSDLYGYQDMTYDKLIEMLLNDLDRTGINSDIDNVKLLVYVDSEGDVIGHRINLAYGLDTCEILLGMPVSGSEFAFEFSVNESGDYTEYVTGSGTIKGDIITGDFSIGDDPTDITVIGVENFDLKALSKGKLCGSFVYNLPSDIMGGVKLRLDIDTDMTDVTGKLSLLYVGEPLASLEFDAHECDYPIECVPTPADKVYDSSVSAEVQEYLNSLNIDTWIQDVRERIGIDFSFIKDSFLPDNSNHGFGGDYVE